MSSDQNNIKELYKLFVQFPFICTDTRKTVPDCLFFCLKGENFDGNMFVKEALEKGARYVITDNLTVLRSYDFTILKVDNVLQTLQQLARHHRNQLKIPIIGITGTNGKTTTKELMVSVLSKKYKTAFTKGNLNNHIGVPLTLLSIKQDDEIAVIEMGANHTGEIAELCEIAQPDYGIITNIGKAHLEGFGTVENIIKTKTALYRAAKTIFVNGGDEILMREANKFKSSKIQEFKSLNSKNSYDLTILQSYGLNYYGKNTETDAEIVEMNPCLVINLFHKKIQTQLTGNYNLPNILAAAAVGRFFNVSTENICNAIAEYSPQNQRSQIIRNNNNIIIADYYNANPTSVKAALDSFLKIDASQKLAILGDMLELGEKTLSEHQAIIDFCETNKIETCFIGDNFYALKNERSLFFTNVEEFNNYLKSHLNIEEKWRATSIILIKGSRGIHLENISF